MVFCSQPFFCRHARFNRSRFLSRPICAHSDNLLTASPNGFRASDDAFGKKRKLQGSTEGFGVSHEPWEKNRAYAGYVYLRGSEDAIEQKHRHQEYGYSRVSVGALGKELKHMGNADFRTSDDAFGTIKKKQYSKHSTGSEHMDEAMYLHMDESLGLHMPLSTERYMSLLKSCIHSKSLFYAKQVYSHIARHGIDLRGLLGDYLVVALAKCGAIEEAIEASITLSRRTVFSWSAMISSYAELGHGHDALRLYQQMQKDGVEPNHFTFVSLFQACGSIGDLDQAKKLHNDASNKGFLRNPFVGNSLISMYTKCGAIKEAEEAFAGLLDRNVVAWNTMLSAYIQRGRAEKTLSLYRQMQEEGETPDHLTVMISLQACGILADREKVFISKRKSVRSASFIMGQTLHADACKMSYMWSAFVTTALVNMYAKCGAVLEAEVVFGAINNRDLATWNSMLTAYMEQGHGDKALQLYVEMQKLGVTMDEITFTCSLQGSAETGCLDICKQLHFSITCAGYDNVHTIAASLINTYGYCASILDGQVFFDTLSEPDYVTWTSCIFGHAWDGNSIKSLCIFDKLRLVGIEADEILLTTILTACSHAGLVSDGLDYFASLCSACCIFPNLKHYGILLDLLGRAGDFKRVRNVLKKMPVKPDSSIWLSLLGICQTHCHVEVAEHAFNHVVHLRPSETYAYILMSNIYEAEARRQKQDVGLKRNEG